MAKDEGSIRAVQRRRCSSRAEREWDTALIRLDVLQMADQTGWTCDVGGAGAIRRKWGGKAGVDGSIGLFVFPFVLTPTHHDAELSAVTSRCVGSTDKYRSRTQRQR